MLNGARIRERVHKTLTLSVNILVHELLDMLKDWHKRRVWSKIRGNAPETHLLVDVMTPVLGREHDAQRTLRIFGEVQEAVILAALTGRVHLSGDHDMKH